MANHYLESVSVPKAITTWKSNDVIISRNSIYHYFQETSLVALYANKTCKLEVKFMALDHGKTLAGM